MAIWKDNTAPRLSPYARDPPHAEPRETPRFDPPSKPELAPSPARAPPVARADPGVPRKESLIAADITIEGKIEGGGSVRIAGKFKGDVNVQGDLTIEAGAKLTGSVRANKVTIAGELEGNVEEASRVDLLQTGVVIGDLKAGSLTVAAGARMRGQAEFGWDDSKGSKAGKHGHDTRRAAPAHEQRAPGQPRGDPRMSALPGDHPRKRGRVPGLPALPALRRGRAMRRQAPALTPLRIEGSIRHPADGEPWEYTVVVSIRNDRGEEIARKLIGVGAMNPNEQRTFTLSVEAVSAKAKTPGKVGTRH